VDISASIVHFLVLLPGDSQQLLEDEQGKASLCTSVQERGTVSLIAITPQVKTPWAKNISRRRSLSLQENIGVVGMVWGWRNAPPLLQLQLS
jgi:hypothetical protein